MTIPASQALNYTNSAIERTNSAEVATEIKLTESSIREASSQQRFKVTHNAKLIGNPEGDPFDDSRLTLPQIDYRNSWVAAGYQVARDEDTGYWIISWETIGPEEVVTQYSVRTTLDPTIVIGSSTVSEETTDQLDIFFDGVTPSATSNSFIVPIDGGDIDETDFGATTSVYYEYIILTTQSVTTDYSDDIKTSLIANVSGYTPSNLMVYKFN